MNKNLVYLIGATPGYAVCLALKYLEACIQNDPALHENYSVYSRTVYLNEWNITNFFLGSNPSILDSDIVYDIVKKNPGIVGYSLYPWNIHLFDAISRQVKLLLPDVLQVVGGPTVSGFGKRILTENQSIDIAFEGEAEGTFSDFLMRRVKGDQTDDIPGIYTRKNSDIVYTGPNHGYSCLDDILSPWPSYEREKDEYIYYEASRGCLWKCKYCAFPRSRKFQHFSMDRIRHDLACIMKHAPRSIYFIDADICADEEFALELLKYLLEQTGETEFGFEFNANNAQPKVIALLGELFQRRKLVELEVGVQTTSQTASRLAGRRLNLETFTRNLELLREKAPKLPYKFNLIFGLPGETEEEFYRSVDFLWRFQPCRIVAYPLCVLPGTQLYSQAHELGICFDDHPPFPVLATREMPLESMLRIRKFSTLLAVAFFKNKELSEAMGSFREGSLSEAIVSFLETRAVSACDCEKINRTLIQDFTRFLTDGPQRD